MGPKWNASVTIKSSTQILCYFGKDYYKRYGGVHVIDTEGEHDYEIRVYKIKEFLDRSDFRRGV